MSGRADRHAKPDVRAISRQELEEKIGTGELTVVDAQAPGWYEREHLPGALRADAGHMDDLATRLGDDPAAEIAVYCWSETCNMSALVSAELAGRGYTNVRRYVEGKKDWIEAGLPIESEGEKDDDSP
jgi:rhodanese-related sulfurtransferase